MSHGPPQITAPTGIDMHAGHTVVGGFTAFDSHFNPLTFSEYIAFPTNALLVEGAVIFTPVGSVVFEANGFGVHDMHGNLMEWCRDFYAEYTAENTTDPTGPDRDPNNNHVMRGGSYLSQWQNIRSTSRFPQNPKIKMIHFGFRVVCHVDVVSPSEARGSRRNK